MIKLHSRKKRVRIFGKTIDLEGHTVQYHKQVRALQPLLVRLFQTLYENRGQVVSKNELIKRLWPDTIVTGDSLTKAISKLRKVLDYGLSRSVIQTVNGNGYRLRKPSIIFQIKHNLLLISLSATVLFLLYLLLFSGLVQWAIETYGVI